MIGFWCHPAPGPDREIDEHACTLGRTTDGEGRLPGQAEAGQRTGEAGSKLPPPFPFDNG